VTAEIAVLALLVSLLIAIPVAMLAGDPARGKLIDRVVTGCLLGGPRRRRAFVAAVIFV